MGMPDANMLPWITAGSAALVALWRTTVSFYATREKNRLLTERTRADIERRRTEHEDQFATGLRNELRADIGRLNAQMMGLETENTSLRTELRAMTRENIDLRREVMNMQARVFQLEGALHAAGIQIPPDRFGPPPAKP